MFFHSGVVIQNRLFLLIFVTFTNLKTKVKPTLCYVAFYDFVFSPPLLQFYGFLECLCPSHTCVLLLYLHTDTDLGPHYAGMCSISFDWLRVWLLRC